MPNGSIHNTAGAILGASTYLLTQNNSKEKEKIDLGELLLTSGIGLSTARIPDMLEPATNPNHRDFFHSLSFGILVSFIGVQAWKDLQMKRNERLMLGNLQWSSDEFWDIVLLIASGSILLHIVMDSFTTKGINII